MESAKIVAFENAPPLHYVQQAENGVLHLSKVTVEGVDVYVRNGNGITEAVKEDDDEREEYLMTQVVDLPCVTHCLQHLDHLGLSACRLNFLFAVSEKAEALTVSFLLISPLPRIFTP